MQDKYIRLKAAMIENDLGENQLGKAIGKSQRYVANRMTDLCAWRLNDVYAICDLLHIPYSEIHLYFPK